MDTLAQIEQYITGEMTGAERAAFEETLKQDTALQQEVDAYKDIIAGIEQAETDAFQGMMQGWEKQIKEEAQPQQAKVRRLFSPRMTMALAAVVVLLLTFTFIFNPFAEPVNLYDSAFQPYADQLTRMGAGDEGFDQQKANQAMAFYNQEQYEEALPLLKELAAENTDMPILTLYQGIAEMEIFDYNSAQESFSSLSSTSLALQGEWYDILISVKADSISATDMAALRLITEKEGHPYQKQAEKLLEDIISTKGEID
jgi:tetratricopeptide (TPR) repeat protein